MLTSGNFGRYAETYTTLMATGLKPGRKESLPDNVGFKQLVFNDTGATILDNTAVSFVAAEAADYHVAPTDTGVDDSLCIGVNDCAGGDIPDQTFFWVTCPGGSFSTPLVAAGLLAGALVAPSAVAGTLDAAGASQQSNIQLLVNSGAGGATSALIQ